MNGIEWAPIIRERTHSLPAVQELDSGIVKTDQSPDSFPNLLHLYSFIVVSSMYHHTYRRYVENTGISLVLLGDGSRNGFANNTNVRVGLTLTCLFVFVWIPWRCYREPLHCCIITDAKLHSARTDICMYMYGSWSSISIRTDDWRKLLVFSSVE